MICRRAFSSSREKSSIENFVISFFASLQNGFV